MAVRPDPFSPGGLPYRFLLTPISDTFFVRHLFYQIFDGANEMLDHMLAQLKTYFALFIRPSFLHRCSIGLVLILSIFAFNVFSLFFCFDTNLAKPSQN